MTVYRFFFFFFFFFLLLLLLFCDFQYYISKDKKSKYLYHKSEVENYVFIDISKKFRYTTF